MKEIKAYVHRSRAADVIAALKDLKGWGDRGPRRHNLVVYVVKGSLPPVDFAEQRYSTDLGEEVVNEYKLEVICEDHEVDEIVATLANAGRTGQSVGGWITVSDLVQVLPIR